MFVDPQYVDNAVEAMSWDRRIRMTIGLCGAILAEGFFLLTIGGLLALWLLPVAIAVSVVLVSGPVGSQVFWLSVLGVVLLLLVSVQIYFVRRQTRATLHTSETQHPEAKQEIETLVARLAQQAAVSQSEVVIASSSVPASLTIGVLQPTIVITEGLLSRLENEAELKTVLAHEIGHIANRDVTITSVVAAVPITIAGVIDRLLDLFRYVLRVDEDEELSDNTKSALLFLGPIVAVFGLGTAAVLLLPIVGGVVIAAGNALGGEGGAVWLIGLFGLLTVQLTMLGIVLVFALPAQVVAYVLGSAPAAYVSRTREFAADRTAAALTGEPETLATVLRRLDGDVAELPTRDARTLRSVQHLCLVPLETDAEDTRQTSFDSHPPTEARLEQLRELESS